MAKNPNKQTSHDNSLSDGGNILADNGGSVLPEGELSSAPELPIEDPVVAEPEPSPAETYTIDKHKADLLVYALIWGRPDLYTGNSGILKLASLFGFDGNHKDSRDFLAKMRQSVLDKGVKSLG